MWLGTRTALTDRSRRPAPVIYRCHSRAPARGTCPGRAEDQPSPRLAESLCGRTYATKSFALPLITAVWCILQPKVDSGFGAYGIGDDHSHRVVSPCLRRF